MTDVLTPACGVALDPLTYFGAPWRTVISTLDGEILTFLDRLASQRTADFVLDAPAQAKGQVPSENPEVNLVHTDGYPFLNNSNRLLMMFRREGTDFSSNPICWVPRFGGILMQPNDQANGDNSVTSYTAYDPWQLLYHKPLIDPNTSDLPDQDGVTYKTMDVGLVVQDILNSMWIYLSGSGINDPHPEAHLDWGQTPYYGGTIETGVDVIWMQFGQTSSVGAAFDQIIGTGLCDIVIEPIWDPRNRPGIVGELSVYAPQAGVHRNSAIMAWDTPSRSLASADALYDGDSLLNEARYGAAQGPSRPLVKNASSISRYGSYWEQDLFVGENSHHEIDIAAAREVGFRKDGKSTYKVTPIVGRSPIPFVEYGLGDMLPVWSSSRMRQPIGPTLVSSTWQEMARVYGISISLSDDDVERVESLTLSKDNQ